MANSQRRISDNIPVNTKIVNSTASESTNGLMVVPTQANMPTIKRKDSASIHGLTARSTRVTGAMVSKTASAALLIQKINRALAAGKMANALSGCRNRMNRMA